MTVVVVILLCFEEKECNAHRESLSLHTCLRDFTLVHRIQFLICAWTHLREITTRIRLLLLWSTQHSMVWFPLCVSHLWGFRYLCNMRDIEHALILLHSCEGSIRWADFAKFTLRSMSYKHLQHQVTGLASVFLNLQSSHAYGRVVSDPIEGAPYNERPLLVLRNAAGA